MTTPQRLLPHPSKRAMRRAAVGLAAFLLLFSVFGFFILPAVVQSQAQRLIADKLQRAAAIGAVEINPYTLTLTVRDFKLMEPNSDETFAGFDTLRANLSLRSALQLAPVVQELRLTQPYVRLARTEAHRYNIDDIIALIAAQPSSEKPARFSINNIQVEGGSIRFDDRPAKTTHVVDQLTLGVPFVSSLPSQVHVFVEPMFSANVNGTPLHFKGKARPFAEPRDAQVVLDLDGLDVTRALEYLPFKPHFKLPSARLDLHLTASFVQPKDQAPSFRLSGTAALKSVRITEPGGKQLIHLPELAVSLRDMDLSGGRFDVARLFLRAPEVDLVRGKDGALNLAGLLPASGAPAPKAKPAAASAGVNVALGELEVRDAAVRYVDEQGVSPLRAGVEKLDLTLRKIALDTRKRTVSIDDLASNSAGFLLNQGKAVDQAGASAAAGDADDKADKADAPYVFQLNRLAISNWSARIEDRRQSEPVVTDVGPLALSVQNMSTAPASRARLELKAIVNKTGRLVLSGNMGLAPFHTDLALEAKGVDILPLQPYVTDRVNLRLTRASLSGGGRLQLDGGDGVLKGGFRGDVALGNVATVDKASGNDFLRWKSLSFDGVDARFAPFALAVERVALNDFFARVIIDAAGRINLQDIARSPVDEGKSLTAAARPAPIKADAQAAPAPIRIGKLTLQGGRVRFTDNFIKPNYSASLSDFGGAVTELSSDPSTSAGVDLHAEVNGAPLSVAGRINPLKGDLFMDLKAHVRGMELAPLSAYSGRYVGYGIEKGRLSFEVAYRVDQRKLSAENRLILEQITFGEKIDSPNATDLPVQFAVALLRDRNGVIDINLPIAGSLDDPEFSVGGVLFRALGNIIAKAVTQPFALLAAMFGGGDAAELSSLAFEPGRSAVPAAGEVRLKALAKALAERPALTLDIAGRVDPEADLAGLRRVSVERKVRAIKTSDLAARGESPAPGSVVVQPGEYPALLARAYKAEKFTKPSNLLGLPKDLPSDEMERLMAANADIDDNDLIALGNQRAQAAKNWLVRNGQVPAERVFIVAAKKAPAPQEGAGAASSRVDFSLR